MFLAVPVAFGNSWAKDQIHGIASTQATTVTVPDPLTCSTGRELPTVFVLKKMQCIKCWRGSVGALRGMKVVCFLPRLGVKSKPQLLAYDTATAMWDLSCVCNQHHSSWQCQILKPLSEAKYQTWVLMDSSQVRYCWAMMGTSRVVFRGFPGCGIFTAKTGKNPGKSEWVVPPPDFRVRFGFESWLSCYSCVTLGKSLYLLHFSFLLVKWE